MPFCKNCNKEVAEGLDFCSKDCINEYKDKNKDAPYLKKAYEQMENEDQITEASTEIYDYLGLNSGQAQKNQQIKIDNMKAVLKMCGGWKKGFYNKWVDWLSIPLGLSTRKVREDYLDPLVSRGVIVRSENNEVLFVGIPRGEKHD